MTIRAIKNNPARQTAQSKGKKNSGIGGFFRSLFSRVTAPKWTNWAENQSCNPTEIFYPETLEDMTAIVLKAKATGKKIRCAASGHSWSSSSVTDGYLVIVNKMQKVQPPVYDGTLKSWTVTVETGVLVKTLDDALRNHDPPLSLPSNVVLDSVKIQLGR